MMDHGLHDEKHLSRATRELAVFWAVGFLALLGVSAFLLVMGWGE